MDKHETHIHIMSQPLEFFRNQITTALHNQKVAVDPAVEFYLVSLLAKYVQAENLQKLSDDPLAISYHKALQSGLQERIQILKEIGDFSLYISGFFADSLNRKLIDIDYYMAMGGQAYKLISQSVAQSIMNPLFIDLANRFSTFADILAEVSDYSFSHTNQDILRLYEKWLKTRSERLASLLKKEGVIPLDTVTTELV